jgi:hypothetical protein
VQICRALDACAIRRRNFFADLTPPFFRYDVLRFSGAASVSSKDLINSTEFELIERELYALSEAEQAAQQRSFALPVGYEKSQALAEY